MMAELAVMHARFDAAESRAREAAAREPYKSEIVLVKSGGLAATRPRPEPHVRPRRG